MLKNVGLTFLCLISVSFAKLCYLPNQGIDSSLSGTSGVDNSLIQCPRPEDSQLFSECCTSGVDLCCEKRPTAISLRFGLNEPMLIAISVAVIAVCVFATVLVLVCCFWSKCPLYNCAACQVKSYQHEETIAFSTKEEIMKLNGMPDEDGLHQNSFEPNSIKIRPVCDV